MMLAEVNIIDIGLRAPANVCGKRIRLLRLERNLSEGALASRLQSLGIDLDYVAIGRIENGRRRVTDYELLGLAAALDVSSIAEIIMGEGALSLQDYALLPNRSAKRETNPRT
jgi:transcriptional regulator with XRE-family HTH domain